jgi:hypothetical protein
MQTWWGNLKEREHLDVLDVNGRAVKWFIMKKLCYFVKCAILAHDRDQLLALLITVTRFLVS